MAVSPEERAPRKSGGFPPVWVTPAHVAGLVLVYLAERVLVDVAAARWVCLGLGAIGVIGGTAARFVPEWRGDGETRRIANVLAGASVTGVVALLVYFATTDRGVSMFGLDARSPESRETIIAVLQATWVSLIACSVVPLVFTELAVQSVRRAERPESRRIRAAATSGLTLALAAVYSSLFVYAAGTADWKVDYSYFKTSEPSDSTRAIAKSLNEEVTITAFFPPLNEVGTEVEGYLKSLADGAPNLKVEVRDRLVDPKLAKELRVTQDGMLVLKRGDVTETMRLGTKLEDAGQKLKKLDGDFQEKLLKVVRARRTAYLTVGHGEINDEQKGMGTGGKGSARLLRKLLQKQNYLVKDLGLAQGLGNEVPSDATIVLVLGPTRPFAPEEIGALKRYADGGGKLLLALDPEATSASEAILGGEAAELGTDEGAPGEAAAESGDDPGDAKPAGSASPGSAKPAGSAGPGSASPGSANPGNAAKAPGAKPGKPAASAKAAGSAEPANGSESGDEAPAAGGASSGYLNALAGVVGLQLHPEILANDTKHMRRRFNKSDRALLISNRFSSHASVSTLSRNSARTAVVAFGTGSLERAPGSTEKVDFAVRSLVGTYADANANFEYDAASEKRKVYNIAAAVSRKPIGSKPEKKDDEKDENTVKKLDDENLPDEMRAFVLADVDAIGDDVLAKWGPNQLWFFDAIRWLGGEESFAGEVNTEEDVPIEHTKQKDLVWFYSTIFGAPALVLGLGLFYSLRVARRRRGDDGGSGGGSGTGRSPAAPRRTERNRRAAPARAVADGDDSDDDAGETRAKAKRAAADDDGTDDRDSPEADRAQAEDADDDEDDDFEEDEDDDEPAKKQEKDK